MGILGVGGLVLGVGFGIGVFSNRGINKTCM